MIISSRASRKLKFSPASSVRSTPVPKRLSAVLMAKRSAVLIFPASTWRYTSTSSGILHGRHGVHDFVGVNGNLFARVERLDVNAPVRAHAGGNLLQLLLEQVNRFGSGRGLSRYGKNGH